MVKSRPSMKKTVTTFNEISDGVSVSSYRLVGLGYYIITGKIITSSNSLITSKSSFSSILLKSLITGKILKIIDKVSEKFDLVRNWAVIGELIYAFACDYNI